LVALARRAKRKLKGPNTAKDREHVASGGGAIAAEAGGAGEAGTAEEVVKMVEVVEASDGASANTRKRELEEYSANGTCKKQKVSKPVQPGFHIS
jgi:hypothetical protein